MQPEAMNFRSAQAKATNKGGNRKLVIRVRKNEHPPLPSLKLESIHWSNPNARTARVLDRPSNKGRMTTVPP